MGFMTGTPPLPAAYSGIARPFQDRARSPLPVGRVDITITASEHSTSEAARAAAIDANKPPRRTRNPRASSLSPAEKRISGKTKRGEPWCPPPLEIGICF